MISLFTQPEKLAAGASSSIKTRVEGQPETWAEQALSDLYEEHPYIAEYQPTIDVVRMDPDRGYMLAFVTVEGNNKKINIPVIVQDHELLPYATFTSDRQVLPLSEDRLASELLDHAEERGVDMTDRELEQMLQFQELEPPDATSWVGNRAVLSKLSWAHMDDFHDFMEKSNSEVYAAVKDRVQQLEKRAKPLSDGVTTEDWGPAHDTMLIETSPKSAQRYRITSTSSHFFKSAHVQEVTRSKAAQVLPAEVIRKVGHDGYAVIGGPPVKLAMETTAEAEKIDRPGIWSVKTDTGMSLTGSVVPHVVDFSGQLLPLCLFYNGAAAAVQDQIAGVYVSELRLPPTEAKSRGESVFLFRHPSGAIRSTIPFVVTHETPTEFGPALVVETYLGDVVRLVRDTCDSLAQVDQRTYLVPAKYSLVNIGHPKNRVSLVELPEDYEAFQKMGQRKALEIIGNGAYDVRGGDVDLHNLDERQAEFTLTALGAPDPPHLLKAANVLGSVRLYGRPPVDESGQMLEKIGMMEKHARNVCADWRPETADIVNAAAWMLAKPSMEKLGDIPIDTVDNVLSLGFIRPENTKTYVDSLGDLEDTVAKLASLVLASQLGYSEVPTEDAINAMEGMEKVITGLRRLKAEVG
jgi:hypothetical protein